MTSRALRRSAPAREERSPRPYLRPLAIALWTCALAAGCDRAAKSSAQESFAAAKKREPARVLVEPLQRREMLRRLETTTRVESESHVQVFPRASGVVVELFAEEGQKTSAGQVLARLDSRDASLRLQDAQTALADARANRPKLDLAAREAQARLDGLRRTKEQAERDHERNVSLSKGGPEGPGLISSKDLDASQLALDRARADLESAVLACERAKVEQQNADHAVARAEVAVSRAELDLSFTEIIAPVAGVVAQRNINLGDTLSSAAPAFTLTDPARLRAVFYRPQRELESFVGVLSAGVANGNGMAARAGAEPELIATAEALPGKTFAGRIERIAPTIDAASGNFRVTARLSSTAAEGGAFLLPGMLVRLEIVTERRPEALVAPKRALRREGDRSTIQIAEGGIARTIEVLEGFSDDVWTEIRPRGDEQLRPGQLVIVVGNRDLEDGAEVVATNSTGAPVTLDAGG